MKLCEWTCYAVGGFRILAVLTHIEVKEIPDSSITVRVLIRNDEPLVKSESEDGLINPANRRSVFQILGNAHLVIHVHCDQTIRPSDVLIMDATAAGDDQDAHQKHG